MVLLGAEVGPHLLIHGRGNGDGGASGQAQGGEQVVAVAMGQASHEIGGRGGNQHQVCPAGQLDMAHGRFGGGVQQGGVHRVAGEGLHGQRGDEFTGALGHDHPHLCAHILQPAHQISGFIGGNTAGDAQQDPFVHQTLHAKTLVWMTAGMANLHCRCSCKAAIKSGCIE